MQTLNTNRLMKFSEQFLKLQTQEEFMQSDCKKRTEEETDSVFEVIFADSLRSILTKSDCDCWFIFRLITKV